MGFNAAGVWRVDLGASGGRYAGEGRLDGIAMVKCLPGSVEDNTSGLATKRCGPIELNMRKPVLGAWQC